MLHRDIFSVSSLCYGLLYFGSYLWMERKQLGVLKPGFLTQIYCLGESLPSPGLSSIVWKNKALQALMFQDSTSVLRSTLKSWVIFSFTCAAHCPGNRAWMGVSVRKFYLRLRQKPSQKIKAGRCSCLTGPFVIVSKTLPCLNVD